MIALAAVGAAVRSHTLVHVIVLGQVELGLEAFWTFRTLYGPWISMRATYVLHHVGLAYEFGVAHDARVLLDAEMRLYMHCTLVPALVELATELARVTILTVVRHLLHVVVHLDLLAIHAEEVLGSLHGFLSYLLQFRQVLQLQCRGAVVLPAGAAEDTVDDTVHFHSGALGILQQIHDRGVDQTRTLVGKHPRVHLQFRQRVVFGRLSAKLHGKANVLGVIGTTVTVIAATAAAAIIATTITAIPRLVHRHLDIGSTGNECQQFIQRRSW